MVRFRQRVGPVSRTKCNSMVMDHLSSKYLDLHGKRHTLTISRQHYNKELKPCEWRVVEDIELCRKPYEGGGSSGATTGGASIVKNEDEASEEDEDEAEDVEDVEDEEDVGGAGSKRKAAAQPSDDSN